jgi:hypothetical protein
VLICWVAPILATIFKYLESDSRRQEGKEKLFNLCDNGSVSKTIRDPLISYHSQASASTARQEDPDDMGNDGGETSRAISRLNHLSPPSHGPTKSSHWPRKTSRPRPMTERGCIPSRATLSESLGPTRTTSRPTINRQTRPNMPITSPSESFRAPQTTTRPSEARRTTVKPPAPSGPPPAYTALPPSSNIQSRPQSGVAIRGFALEAGNQRTTRPQRPAHIAAPASPSPQTVIYMKGGGTPPPTYISPSKFFAEHGEGHGLERPPAYATTSPTRHAAAHWIPRDRLGEDWIEMAMEGRRDMVGVRRANNPDSIPRAQNGVGGGEGERDSSLARF